MNICDDGKCPLNRQGVPHETHELIESRHVKNPCNDPRCAMNRMGIRHDIHDGNLIGGLPNDERASDLHRQTTRVSRAADKLRDDVATSSPKYTFEKGDHMESPDDALSELLKRLQRDHPSQFYRPPPRNNSGFSPHSRPKETAIPTQMSKPSQKSKGDDSEIRKILDSRDPHDILGVSKNATIDEIKARYREMAKKHDPSQGIIHKSALEKERSNKIMAKINHAFAQLKRVHRGA